MTWPPSTALGIAVAVVLVLLGAAMLPVRLALHVTGDLAAGFTITLRYRALGLIRGMRVLRVPRTRAATPASAAAPTGAAGSARDAAAEASPAPASTPPSTPRAALGARLERLGERIALLRRLLRSGAVRIERPRGRIELALDDPAETGRAFGVLCALAALLDPDGAIEIQPLWTATDHLASDLAIDARVVPLWLALIAGADWLGRRRAPSLPAAPREGPSHAA